MKKIAVTGASGFLGRRVAKYYKNNYKVFTPTHKEMDICREEQVRKILTAIKPDIVIHCAAISDVGVCERNPEDSYTYNVLGMLHIARICKEIGAVCILCSSDQVYFGGEKEEAWKEDDSLTPGNVYGKHKLLAEELCLKENPDCIALRLSWMYDTKNLSETEHSDFMRTFIKNKKENTLLPYEVNDYRGLTNVQEVVANMEQLFTALGGVYNFGAPNSKNMYETVCDVYRELAWDASEVMKNETSFQEKKRNITMDQVKINSIGIYFTDTTQGLVKAMRSIFVR